MFLTLFFLCSKAWQGRGSPAHKSEGKLKMCHLRSILPTFNSCFSDAWGWRCSRRGAGDVPVPEAEALTAGAREHAARAGSCHAWLAASIFPLVFAPRLLTAWIWQPLPSQCGLGFCYPPQSSVNHRFDLVLTRGRRLEKELQLREVKVKTSREVFN